MNEYLITPHYTLGSDSFAVFAESPLGARAAAFERIHKEGWHSPHGWDMYLKVFPEPFEDMGSAY